MAVTVADIAKKAFDITAARITDAVQAGTLDDGNYTYTGRVVFGGEKAPGGFPIATAKDKPREAYLEGFSQVAAIGDTITAGGLVYHVLSVRNIVEAGGFVVARVVSASEITWTTGNFQRLTPISDGAGGYTQTWCSIPDLSAAYVGLVSTSDREPGSEQYQSQRIEAVSSWQVWGKGLEDIKEADRVVIGGVTYQIHFVNNIEGRGVWTVLDVGKGMPT